MYTNDDMAKMMPFDAFNLMENGHHTWYTWKKLFIQVYTTQFL